MISAVGHAARQSSRRLERFEARPEDVADGGIATAMSPDGGNMYGKDIHRIDGVIEVTSLAPEGRDASWRRPT